MRQAVFRTVLTWPSWAPDLAGLQAPDHEAIEVAMQNAALGAMARAWGLDVPPVNAVTYLESTEEKHS